LNKQIAKAGGEAKSRTIVLIKLIVLEIITAAEVEEDASSS